MPKCLTLAFLAAVLFCAGPAGAQPAAPASGVREMPTDVSAAKRKHHARYRVYVAPAYAAPAYSQWRNGDPGYGPGTPQLRARQQQGGCVIDEGYGRYMACPNQ